MLYSATLFITVVFNNAAKYETQSTPQDCEDDLILRTSRTLREKSNESPVARVRIVCSAVKKKLSPAQFVVSS